MDQTYWIHQHLSQIPVDYIRSYMISIGMEENPNNNNYSLFFFVG